MGVIGVMDSTTRLLMTMMLRKMVKSGGLSGRMRTTILSSIWILLSGLALAFGLFQSVLVFRSAKINSHNVHQYTFQALETRL